MTLLGYAVVVLGGFVLFVGFEAAKATLRDSASRTAMAQALGARIKARPTPFRLGWLTGALGVAALVLAVGMWRNHYADEVTAVRGLFIAGVVLLVVGVSALLQWWKTSEPQVPCVAPRP
jgi:putative Mn2+ efflux pump MntP